MHTGPQPTGPSTGPTGPGSPRGGQGTALLYGVIAFAAVFLLIVGGTVGFLLLRPDGTTPVATGSATSTETDTAASDGGTDQGSASATPTEEVTPERCWSPENQTRTSSNPSGRLRGGGLQFIPPALYTERGRPSGVSFADDLQGAQAKVEDSWYSTMFVGAVVWQPGIEYPGAEEASQQIVSCFFSAPIWGEAKGRSLDDEVTEPVTISGMSGYRTTATVNFSSSPLTLTTGTELVVVVVDTPQGPSVFGTETAVGVPEHEAAADEALESLTGIG